MTNLGVIGSGNMGTAIGAWAVKQGYHVTFSDRDLVRAQGAARASGGKHATVEETAKFADMLLLALPYDVAPRAVHDLAPRLQGKILIDITNALTKDMTDLQVGHTTSAAEEIAKLVPSAQVVKAFNTNFAQIYASQKAEIHGTRLSVFLASDHEGAKTQVGELAGKMGFDVVDCGPLRAARFIEPMAMLNIFLGYQRGMGTEIGFTLNHPKAAEKEHAA